jgi:hypothetical protein
MESINQMGKKTDMIGKGNWKHQSEGKKREDVLYEP